MAANIFTGAVNNNWNTAGNWSLGSVPTFTDGNIATFDATSPNCTLNAVANCNNIDFSGYINTITMSNLLIVNGNCTLSSGMTISGSSNLRFNGTTCNLTSNGKVWKNGLETTTPYIGSSGVTLTLLDDWVVSGNLIFASNVDANTRTAIVNGFSLTFGGGLTVFTNGIRYLVGTTNLIANGTGTIICGVDSYIATPLEINTSGTITFSTRFYKRNGLFKYTSGTTQTNGCTFVFGKVFGEGLTIDVNGDTSPSATTLSSTGINIYILNTTLPITTTLLSPLRVINSHTGGRGNFNSGAYIYNRGTYTVNSNTGANLYNYIMDGTGTITTTAGSIRHNLTFNTTGTITFTSLDFGGTANQVLTYVPNTGTINAGTLIIGRLNTPTTLNTNSLVFSTVQFQSYLITTTLNSTLNCTNCNFLVGATFAGTGGINADNFNCNVAGSIITLKNGVTYTVNSSLNLNGKAASPIQLKSSTASSYAFFDLASGATCDVKFVKATDIDSSGGRLITDVKGTLLRTVNWYKTNPDYFAYF